MILKRKYLRASCGLIAVAMAAITLSVGSATAAERLEDIHTDHKRDRILLLDSRIIASTQNAKLTLGKVKKHPANPLFGEDKPWEARFDNLYANVIYDQEDKIYKCWYSPFIIDNSAKGMTPDQRNKPYRAPDNREMAICYAISRDGIQWEKPALGLVDFNDSKENNIVWRKLPGSSVYWKGPHGGGVFKDLLDADPKRRYKAIFKGEMISVGFSADGIHWGEVIPCPEANVAGDTHNNAFWAPTLNKYIGITRSWGDQYGRQVARTESNDFLNWTEAKVVLEGVEKNLQTYAMPVFYYAGVYLGLVAIHNQETDRVWTELTWSPDTRQWYRICPGTPLIANSEKEMAYDWGCVYAATTPIFLDDEIRIYYGGSDGYHFGWRNGFFCLATLRPDGFAGYEAICPEDLAIVTTQPLIFQGNNLCISADMPTKASIKVLVKDESGSKIATSQYMKETMTDGKVKWADSKTQYQGKRVRLEFIINNAKLYSFSFTD